MSTDNDWIEAEDAFENLEHALTRWRDLRPPQREAFTEDLRTTDALRADALALARRLRQTAEDLDALRADTATALVQLDQAPHPRRRLAHWLTRLRTLSEALRLWYSLPGSDRARYLAELTADPVLQVSVAGLIEALRTATTGLRTDLGDARGPKRRRPRKPAAWIKPGARCHYHAIIRGPVTQRDMVIRAGPQRMGDHWSVWLEGKPGSVDIEAISRAPGFEDT